MPCVLLITGLRVPLVGRAPRDGKRLVKRLTRQYPAANLASPSWWERIDVEPLMDVSPLILIGHSFGGGACVYLANELHKRGKAVDELLLLDPVPTDFAGRWKKEWIDVPPNVKQTRCIARHVRWYPRSKLARGANVTNDLRSIPHDRYMSNDEIVGMIEAIVNGLR